MKKFWKLLLLMPLLPIIGLTPSDSGEEETEEEVNDNGEENEQEEDDDDEEVKEEKKKPQEGRFFTQKQVTAMMTEEKKQGRRSILTALGFKSLEEAKRALVVPKKDEGVGKKEKSTEQVNKDISVEDRYEYLVLCIKEGVDPEDADDVVTLVLKRMGDEESFSEALKEFRKAKPTFFGRTAGTGSSPRGKKVVKEKDSLGARLGKQVSKAGKNPYFND